MSGHRLLISFFILSILLAGCAGSTPTAVSVPTATNVPTAAPTATALTIATAAATGTAAATEPPAATALPSATPVAAGPFAHTACAAGTDLTGQTVNLYHLVDASSQQDEFVTPLKDGFEDASAYFNAHGGVCGAQVAQRFPDPNKQFNTQVEYSRIAGLNPKPVMVAVYSSPDAELLRDQLTKDQIPALGIRVGSVLGLYGDDGQTPGWIFGTNPLYPDQFGSFCKFVSQHPEQYPRPVIGYLSWDDGFGSAAYKPEAITYCASLGVKVVDPPAYFSDTDTDIHAHVQTLIDAGANILYTNSLGTGPALIAKTLVEMKLQGKVALAAVNWGLDTSVGRLGQATLGAGGLPSTNSLLGSLPLRTWAETDQPGIKLITDQADLHQRPQWERNNFYILAWASTDLYIELYIQTGNRVGFNHITGAEMKMTLENIVYSPLGGIETINYQQGTRRALSADRIGQMAYLGRDGKTAAGPGNPLLLVSEGGQQVLVPLLVPQSDFQPAPDLRPGGADVPAMPVVTHTGPLSITAQLLFGSNRDGNTEIYRMNADGSELVNLTNNPAMDWGPALSPDGAKIVFSSDRDGNSEVYVMNADGSGQTRLTNNPADDGGPFSWTPDGKKIIFKTNRDAN
jgi:ABC-type branched-subunit amino acid transport system substrate-binding protein